MALGRVGADPDMILDAIVARAARLCRADAAQLYLVDGDHIRLSRMTGARSEEFRGYIATHPVAKNRTSLVGRVAVDHRTQRPGGLGAAPGGGADAPRRGRASRVGPAGRGLTRMGPDAELVWHGAYGLDLTAERPRGYQFTAAHRDPTE